jgi:Zn-dependent metalloprotease
MLLKAFRLAVCLGLMTTVVVTADAATQTPAARNPAIDRLAAENGGASISVNPATGAARFVRLPAGSNAAAGAATAQAKQARAADFINRYAAAFGLRSGIADLALRRTQTDKLGQTHLTYAQLYAGLPVFGSALKVHFDARGRITVVNGTLIPDIQVSPAPSRGAADAAAAAVQYVTAAKPGAMLSARGTQLMIFRAGLVKGVPGDNHLAYEVEVGNGADVREFVYVDAHTAKVIDQVTGMQDSMFRRAYDGMFLPDVPPGYPDSPFWVEGDPFPTGNTEADNMLLASQETYDMYFHAFGRDSFDAAGAMMDQIFNRGYSCPNASWNGQFISFCIGLTTDDVTAHEWSHAYTQYTDGLIYQWQPGALNEAASDIFGETVDRINGRGGDTPDNPRTADSCSLYWGSPPPTLIITGGNAEGSYPSKASVNEPPRPFTIGPLPMVMSEPAGACTPITNDVAGQVVIIDWTLNPDGSNECGSTTRAANAVAAEAAGIIFVAPSTGLLNLSSSVEIGSVEVLYDDGNKIKAGLPADATMTLEPGTDDSLRWLLGEDNTDGTNPVGPFRDMWNPRCFGNPGKVTDTFEYTCSEADAGGVHTNSGVDNHAYSLIVDGGSYNGETISAIGFTKAAHVYFRAKTEYQTPMTDFPDHADAIEQSCADLIGVNLASLTDGTPSGEIISTADCDQVAAALRAVEMRTPPAHCNFQPLLAQDPPALCEAPLHVQRVFFRDNFEQGNGAGWTVSHEGTPDFTERDWSVVSDLPDDREGSAFFGPNPVIGTCAPGGDESAVLHLDSPLIDVPGGQTGFRMAFDHWVATEPAWDGGNVKLSVGGKPWLLIKPEHYVYNPYNTTLVSADGGNTNPIAGEPAFSGTDGGAPDGSWGRSIINLDPYLDPRDEAQFRFDLGSDGCNGAFGWYVDRVWIYQCR